uniref:Ig-like domain-containing protein n=1 Tax=Amphiprion ocellaris TaxID=80972 RepID=A0AAQ6A0I7_AMPOC
MICFSTALLGVLMTWAQTEMKRVVGGNATLPCHHQFWVGDDPILDIEWLLLKPTNRQRVVITYFAGRVFDPNEAERGHVAFTGDYLKGDASLLISDLTLTDSGEYSCKVKTGAQYHWSTISLIVLAKPSKPRCWMEGKLLEGGDVKMSCKSTDGSDPIYYKWERKMDKDKYAGKLPPLTLIDLKNPEIVTLRNLTKDNTGVYKCTASNDVGEESCTVEVNMHCEWIIHAKQCTGTKSEIYYSWHSEHTHSGGYGSDRKACCPIITSSVQSSVSATKDSLRFSAFGQDTEPEVAPNSSSVAMGE